MAQLSYSLKLITLDTQPFQRGNWSPARSSYSAETVSSVGLFNFTARKTSSSDMMSSLSPFPILASDREPSGVRGYLSTGRWSVGTDYLYCDGGILAAETQAGQRTSTSTTSRQPSQPLDVQRFVVGSDGSVYYTDDHYKKFHKVNPSPK
jgi:hypothetical protein